MKDWIEDRIILKVYRGSHAYGLNTENSDIDVGGIYVPPIEDLIGLSQYNQKNEHYTSDNYTYYPGYETTQKRADVALFSIRKFVNLAIGCNPNIIETLYTSPDDIIYVNKFGKELIKNRDMFLSKKARFTFGQYTMSQIKAMDKSSKLIRNYTGKRQESIANYGFDTKAALHLIRLLRMAIEIAHGEGCKVRRTSDKKHLLNIKNGYYSLEQIKQEAGKIILYLDEAYDESSLPDKPDIEKIDKMLIDITLEAGFDWAIS